MDFEFKPLSDGLGFHPFSEGLPYSKSGSKPNGGSQKVAPKAATQPEVSRAYGRGALSGATSVQLKSAPVQSYLNTLAQKPVAVVASQGSAQNVKPADSQEAEKSLGLFSTLFKRMGAYSVDGLLHSLFAFAVLEVILKWRLGTWSASTHLLMDSAVFPVVATFAALTQWVLVPLEEVVFGTTLGKRLFALTLVNREQKPARGFQIFVRALLFQVNWVFLGMGFFWVFFDSKRRFWHDLVSGVSVDSRSR